MKHKKSFKLGMLFIFFVTIISPFIASYLYIPEEIKIVSGREHKFKFYLPIKANISLENEKVLKINNQKVNEDNIDINLNEGFSISPSSNETLDVKLKLLGILPIKTVKMDVIPPMEIVPCGMTVGVNVETDGIMVLGTGNVNGIDGKTYEPSKGILQSGDLILSINGEDLDDKEELIDCIKNSNEKELKIKIKRQNEIIETSITPVKSKEDKEYKIGAWVRDETQGIGTLTYYNPNTKAFGALGHGITDIDTKKLMPIKEGKIMKAEVTSIKKGQKGVPGELTGAIFDTEESKIGTVKINTSQGIFGKIDTNKEDIVSGKAYPIALHHEVHEGKAVILCNISGDKVEEFEINIEKVSKFTQDTSKGMVIEITDVRLLNKTNGIVQGMSGSPILQDGKLIGAVTHVFVQNPTKGYGIFIENMLKKEESIK